MTEASKASGLYVSSATERLTNIPARIGLIAGEGNFPILLAQAARSEGVEVVVFGIHGYTHETLQQYANGFHLLRLTDISRLIELARQHGIRDVIMAGRVPHNVLFKQVSLDPRLWKIIGSLAGKKADQLLQAAVNELAKEGITVLDSTMFIKSLMPEPGIVTTRVKPTDEIIKEVEFAYPLAKEIGRLDIGQTIAVKNQVVVAVEALEGTDELIKRSYDLAGEGIVFVKVAKPRQDMRFDVPVVGITTIRNLAAVRASALCVTARQSLFFDRPEAVELAEQNRICILARSDDQPFTIA